MNRIALLLLAAATVSAAQTAPAPKTATTATAHKPATAAAGVKLPPGVPVVRGIVKTAFALKYEDYKIGTGKLAEPGKVYSVHYTGWLASDGKKFDSSYDHRQPVVDKDGKPVNDADGKPKLGDPQPLQFPQGRGRLIPGWDQGFEGMHVGGKRRLFIPYQLAYGAIGRPPVIPAKANLIFDVELMDVVDLPPQQGGPGGRPMPRPGGMPGAPRPQTPGQPSTPGQPTSPVAPPTPPAPGTAKPVDPTKPTVSPNSAPPPPPKADQPAAPPDKPTNPSQPN